MAAGGCGEEGKLPGLKEEEATRVLFGEELMERADHGGGSAAEERSAFEETFCCGGGIGMLETSVVGLDGEMQPKVVETSLLGAARLEDDIVQTSTVATGDQEERMGPVVTGTEAVAEVAEFGRDVLLPDPSVPHDLHDQQRFPIDVCASYGDSQMIDTGCMLDTVASPDQGAEDGHPSAEAINENGLLLCLHQGRKTCGQFVELRPGYHKAGVPGCSTPRPRRLAVASGKTLNRDLPDQLEAHAHQLLKDAGWNITPRKRNDRPKMASYFAAPQREVVVISLTQAWKFCGQRLCKASGDLEREKNVMEWSDIDIFWKDLMSTMAHVRKMTAQVENSLTLLQRWQLLDPFVAVVFIDKKITVLQKGKTLRAVDSSTYVIDDGKTVPSENHNVHKTGDLLPDCINQSILPITGSDCSQALQSCHDSSSSCCSRVKPSHAENHINSNNVPEQLYSAAKLSNSLVKRVRKRSKWISDIESTGLNGLYAQSFMQPTIGLNEKAERNKDAFKQESDVAILDLPDAEKVDDSKRPGICSAVSTLKKHVETKTKLAKLNGKNRDLSLPSEGKQISKLWCEGRIEELIKWNILSDTESVAKESGAEKFVTIKKLHKQSKSLKKSSMRTFSKDMLNVSNDSNVLSELSHEHNATVLEYDTSLEAQSQKEITTKRKSENREKYMKKRPCEMNFNDDDLLITAIVKNKDLSSSCKFASNLVFSDEKFRKLKSPKRSSRLLIRTSGKGGTNSLDGRRIILARKTVLCWLIATGFATLKDVVQCRNPKNNVVVKDGWVTWDGILCNCCIKTFSISEFKAHAGSSLPKSSMNLFLQSGKSLILCQLEAWSAEHMVRRSNACIKKAEEVDENDDTCGFCGDGGELLCCDNCPSTYHHACLTAQELPEGSWYCHNCICRSCGCPVSEKEVSSFSVILKCLQCGDAYHDTCIERELMLYEDTGSDTWLCGRYCKEIFIGLRNRVGVENFLDNGLSWTILRCNSGGQKLHSMQKIAHMVECNTKLAVALTLMEECFVQMVDTRTGIDMIPHVLYNQGSKYARLDYQGFYTVILEKGEEILCAASIRVHGTKAAELPFIATCAEYRRQGMCRRLIDTIEKMLRSFHVKMLVLSAIPELVSTWVSGFGFKPIEEYERKQIGTINLMLFPGTSLLTKSLKNETEATKSGEEKDVYDVSGLPNGKCLPNGRASEHLEQHDLDLLELNTEKLAATPRRSKDECKPATWCHSAKLAIGEV